MASRSYRRNLPHVFPKGHAIFVTWRLAGSLPHAAALAARKAANLTEGERFVRVDRYLDAGAHGPLWLRNEQIAEDICAAIERGGEKPLEHYTLHEYVVMSNHVHLLITPRIEMKDLMQLLKGSTAHYANKVLRRAGSFWQQEYYDHFCRTPAEFDNISAYIARNPVKVGLVTRPEDWPWSSAGRRHQLSERARAEMAQPETH